MKLLQKPQKIKWSDLKKIEIVRYHDLKSSFCFYTVKNKVKNSEIRE